ncbi:MAG: pantoate--beta-alanine ligase [Chromatiales bacterium]|nr:pantoate--beta-alanine ligase [Chromatiales bacterium]
MFIAKNIAEVRKQTAQWRKQGQSIALVPTMGALHEGHLSLVTRALNIADKVAVSIFVNPMQFDQAEDLQNYPSNEAQDLAMLERYKVGLAFVPTAQEMHNADPLTGVHLLAGRLAEDLCGKFRPQHFDGVATIVAKLLNIFQPDIILLGQKDYQQLCIVRELVNNLSFNVEVVSVETVRTADGLALSSRNAYLSEDERKRAAVLYRSLKRIANSIEEGANNFAYLKNQAYKSMKAAGLHPEYIEIRCAHSLKPLHRIQFPLVILTAVRLGKARLIDNIICTNKPTNNR